MPRFDLGHAAVSATLSALGYRIRSVRTRTGDVRILDGRGRGEGPTLVLLHGLGSRGADYLPLLQRLRPHVRRVIAPDLPGHGASEAPADLDVGECLDGLGEALDETLDEPAVVFGNSLGGLAAIRFALARPRHVRGLFLASPAGAPMAPHELEALGHRLHFDTHAAALRFIQTVFHEEPGPLRHVIAWNLRRRYRARSLRALVHDVRGRHSLAAADLRGLTMPVHLLWGRSDRLLPASNLEFFRAHLLGATIDQPHGMGHSPQLDDVNDVARRVVAFARAAHERVTAGAPGG